MNKTDLVSLVSSKAEVSKKTAALAVDAVFDGIQETLEKGEKAVFVGFGTFEVRQRAARNGRNPQDPKKIIKIPAKKTPAFKPGKSLKDAVEK